MRDSLDCVCVCPLKPSYTCCLHSASETNRANKQERWCPLGPAWYFPALRGKGEREVKGRGPFPVVRLQGCWKTFYPLDLETKRKWRYHLHVWSLTCTRRIAPPSAVITASALYRSWLLHSMSRLLVQHGAGSPSCFVAEGGVLRGATPRAQRRASLSLVSTLLSQSPEFPWRPLAPCHSAWLETAGYHGRMYGACWYKVQHRRISFIFIYLKVVFLLLIIVAAIIQHVFFTACSRPDESSSWAGQPNNQTGSL